MTHVPDSSSFPSALTPALPWWWQLLDADGGVIEPDDGRQEFPTRSDAESWIGEFWADLAANGVAAVTLYEADREVYGPMPLSA